MRTAKKFLLNAIILTITTLILRMVDVSFIVYISNKIGAEGMGVYQLILSVYRFAITLSISGIELATIRLVAEELACNSHSGVRVAMRRCIIYSTFFSILSAILLSIFANVIVADWLHHRVPVNSIYALAISLPFLSLSAVFGGYFLAVRRVIKSASGRILEQFVKITATVYLLNLFMPKGLQYAVLALVLGGVLSEFVSFFYLLILFLHDKRRYHKHTTAPQNLTSRMFHIALPVAISSYVRSGLNTYKQIMIPIGLEKSGVSSGIALSQYGIITGMVIPVIMFPSAFLSAFSSLLIPEIADKFVLKLHKRINYVMSRIFKVTLLFSICMSGIFITYSQELSMLIYKNSDAAYFIRLLAPLVVAMYFDDIVDAILKGINQQVYVVKVNIIDTASCILLLYTLLPLYGIKGYVLVIFISEIFNVYFSIRRLIKITGCELLFLWWIIIPSVVMTFAVYITKMLEFTNLYINIAAVITIYALILSAVGILRHKDFEI